MTAKEKDIVELDAWRKGRLKRLEPMIADDDYRVRYTDCRVRYTDCRVRYTLDMPSHRAVFDTLTEALGVLFKQWEDAVCE